jgi:diguanylate cyclase (GGDEF)-like protein
LRYSCVFLPAVVLADTVYLYGIPVLKPAIATGYVALVSAAGVVALYFCAQVERQERRQFLLERAVEAKNARLVEMNAQLARWSLTDALTGLPNRRCFENEYRRNWDRCMRLGAPMTVLMMDLDHFKRVNDLFGHDMGDTVIRRVGAAIRESLREEQDMVARYGGEEFVAYLPNRGEAAALQICQRLAVNVGDLELTPSKDERLCVTMSIGAATAIPVAGSDPMGLLRAADGALYQAKMNGRDQICRADLRVLDTARIAER